MNLSLCMIVKPTVEEAKMLERALVSVDGYVDEICLTFTKGTHTKEGLKACKKVAKDFGAKVSYFNWVKDFGKARNFNFSQATNDYIFWIDCDDVVKGAKNLPGIMSQVKEKHLDAVVMNYLYDFDPETKICTVKHLKTRIVRKTAARWEGALHEDFIALKDSFNSELCKDIEIMQITDEKKAEESAERNLEIAENEYKLKPEDPRSHWLMANAYNAKGLKKFSEDFYKSFIGLSKSREEKYIAYLSLAGLYEEKNLDIAIAYLLEALNMIPTYPNAYFKLAELNLRMKNYEACVGFSEVGLQLPVPELSILVYNPRDYDVNPLVILSDCYYQMGKYKKALEVMKLLKDKFPTKKSLREKFKFLTKELEDFMDVDALAKELEGLNDKDFKKRVDALPEHLKYHPGVRSMYNMRFIKQTASGKDLVYLCYPTSKEWNPDKQDIGGSEEAVINLSRELAELGWNVTVYNSCGKKAKKYGKVWFKPFWMYNYRDKQDVTILWRSPNMADYEINSDKIYVDLHDVIKPAELTKERLEKIDKIFVKTQAHRDLFEAVPDDKFSIIPNGVNANDFEGKFKKDPYYILNTSSPDRHLDATLDVFEELIKREPDKPWKLGWFYGWDLYEQWHTEGKPKEWMDKQKERFSKLVEAGRAEGGKFIPQDEIVEKYKKSSYFLYPTQFYEIHCISAVKAQLAKCKMVTSDFAALSETVKAKKVHTDGEKWGSEFTFGDSQVDEYLSLMKEAETGDSNWAKKTYNWKLISKKWSMEI